MDIDARQKLLDEIEIPEPTDEDRRWAENTKDKKRSKLHLEFHVACRDRKLWRANFLLDIERQDGTFKDRGMNIDETHSRDWHGRYLPLIDAVDTGDIDFVKLVLGHGADINKPLFEGKTALTAAAGQGYLDIVKLLIEHGATLGYNGFGAISEAHSNGHTLVTRYLEGLQREQFEGIVETLPDEVERNDAPNDTPGGWHMLNNHTVALTSRADDGFTLRRVFNFSAGEVDIIRTLETGNSVQSLGNQVRNFSELQDDSELRLAHAKLVELGGSPGGYASRKKVVSKPCRTG